MVPKLISCFYVNRCWSYIGRRGGAQPLSRFQIMVVFIYIFSILFKVEKILKGSLDSIPFPSSSVKTQIMGGKVCLRFKGKTLLGIANKLFVFKSLYGKKNGSKSQFSS